MLVVGIAGGSGSGKTSIVNKIIEKFPQDCVSVLSQDSYYKDNGSLTQEEKENFNFDHPSAIEFSLLNNHIQALKAGHTIQMPTYSYVTCARGEETIPVKPSSVLIVEGILIFTNQALCELLDLKVFVDTDADERLIRIIQRDVQQRGRGLDKSIRHYKHFVKPMHELFIEPTKRHADIIIPIGGENEKGIDILTTKIQHVIEKSMR
ncbi:MAG: uridine kinase [Bacteroidales bacterium]|nr:uridine kinase [Bacteroidales bacterium]MBR6333536.1 uridine kinase [Bacteroidales bacterium]